jgi:hypothetical protein
LNDIAFFFFFFCVGDSWGGLIAFDLLAIGGIGGIVGWIVGGGVPKRKPGSVSIVGLGFSPFLPS